MSKTNKLLLGLGLVAVVAIPLTIVSCGPNEEKPPVVDPEKPIPPIEPPIDPPVLGDVLTKEIADGFFNGGKWNGKKTFEAGDFDGFKSIGNFALRGKGLISVNLPNSITSIGQSAFANNELTSLNIPNSVLEIGDDAFFNNRLTLASLITLPTQFDNPTERQRIGLPFEEIIVPEPIINLELSAKTNTGEIVEDEINHLNETYKIVEDKSLLLIKKLFNIQDANDQKLIDGLKIKILSSGLNKTVWLTANEGFKINGNLTEIDSISFVINIPPIDPPVSGDILTKEIADGFFNGGKWNGKRQLTANDFEGFTSIGDYALSGRQLTSVVLSNEIISIGDYSFFNNAIDKFTFGQNLQHIGDHAFSHNDLTKIVLPSKLKTLGESAFVTNFINSINIPSSLKIISNNAFAGNPITAIIIPNSITHIGAGAFDAAALTSLHIPDSVISIGDGAFANNPWTASSSIRLPAQFDNPTERQRIGLTVLKITSLNSLTLIQKKSDIY